MLVVIKVSTSGRASDSYTTGYCVTKMMTNGKIPYDGTTRMFVCILSQVKTCNPPCKALIPLSPLFFNSTNCMSCNNGVNIILYRGGTEENTML